MNIREKGCAFAKFESDYIIGSGLKHDFACANQPVDTIHNSEFPKFYGDLQISIVSTHYGFTITFPIMCGWIVQK